MFNEERYSYVADAWDAGFKIEPVDSDRHPDNNLLPSECNALMLSRSGVDYREMSKNTLFSVNGRVDRGYPIDSGIVLKHSYDRNHTDNSVMLIRFNRLGTLDITSMDKANIFLESNIPIRQSYMVKVGTDLTDKIIIAVLNGHLHIHDRAIEVTGEHTLKIHANMIPMLERFISHYSTNTYGIDNVVVDLPYVIDQKTFHSNDNLFKYITYGDSFIATLDANDIDITYHDVSSKLLPGRYELPTLGNDLAVDFNGLAINYKLLGSPNGIVMALPSTLDWNPRSGTTDSDKYIGTTIEPDPPYTKKYNDIRVYRLKKNIPRS